MQDFEKLGVFYLGRLYDMASRSKLEDLLLYDSKDLVTHAVCIGMTGSGKTGLCVSLIEEAAIDGVPSILIDPKGDLTNLFLTFPNLQAQDFLPWINIEDAQKKGLTAEAFAAQQANFWRDGLAKWGEDGARIKRLRDSADFRIYTPGSSSGLPVSILKSFTAPPIEVREDEELLQEQITTTVTSLLSLLGVAADPIKSREHILLSNIFASCWRTGEGLDLARLIQFIQLPSFKKIGVLDVDSFFPSKDRFELAMQLNNLLAAPGFGLWLEGEAMDVGSLLYSPSGKPRVSIFYIAHLSDAQRMFFVSLLLNQIVGWMRTQSGTTSLRSLLYIDEVFGYLPPVANPPSKLPLLTLLKQARAFGLGVVLATQNPVDLDYKALSNAGTWFIGRLQTERDKERVLDGLEGAALSGGQKHFSRSNLDSLLSGLGNRVFLMNNVHEDAPAVFETRWAMSYLRGPLTREQIKVIAEPLKKHQVKEPLTSQASSKPYSTVTASTVASTANTVRPIVPPGVQEFFIPTESNFKASSNSIYKPMILGAAQVRYVDSKADIDAIKEQVFLTPVSDNPLPVSWQNSEESPLKISDLQSYPVKDASFDNLPAAAMNAKNYSLWQKDFSNWLITNQKLSLLKSSSLGTVSKPGETERDFRIRLQQVSREKRDEQVDKLKDRYATEVKRLDDKIRRAEQVLDKEKSQASSQKYQTAISIGESILGSLFSRRSSSRVSKTAKALSRSRKESKDREAAEDNLEELKKQRAKLESKFKSEVESIEDKINPLTTPLETFSLSPSKSNITVRLIALVWIMK